MRKTKITTIAILMLTSQVFGQEAEHKAAAVASAAFKSAKSESVLPTDAPSIKQAAQSESILPADAAPVPKVSADDSGPHFFVLPIAAPRTSTSPIQVLKMTTKLEPRNRYISGLDGTWISLRVRNVSDQPISSMTARIELMDQIHDRVFDTLKLQFVRESLVPRHLEPGKQLTFEARLGEYAMPSDWQYGTEFGPNWTSQHVKIVSVLFKDGSVWNSKE